jgi:hypothetical protein
MRGNTLSTLIFLIAAVLFYHALRIKDAQDWARYRVAHNCEQVADTPTEWECDNNITLTRPNL